MEKERYIYRKCMPAPLFVNKLKKSKKIVNILNASDNQSYGEGEEYSTAHGNQEKRLDDKYVYLLENGNSIIISEPVLDIIYHHSKKEKFSKNIDRDNDEIGLLYTMKVIKENQYFSGSIVGKKKYIDAVLKLLGDNIKIGKSKSVQYGICNIIKKEISDYSTKINFKKGDVIHVVFESSGIFIKSSKSENSDLSDARYTVRYDDIKCIVAEALGICVEDCTQYTYLQTETITGYNTVWNLKKPSFSAVKQGSVISYYLKKDAVSGSANVTAATCFGSFNWPIKIVSA